MCQTFEEVILRPGILQKARPGARAMGNHLQKVTSDSGDLISNLVPQN